VRACALAVVGRGLALTPGRGFGWSRASGLQQESYAVLPVQHA
jgi:hypothetical protein